MASQEARAAHLVVVVVEIDAGVHAALDHLQGREVALVPRAGENEDPVRRKAVREEVLPEDGGADVVGVDLLEPLFLQLQPQRAQALLVAVHVVLIKVVRAGDAPGEAPVDILQRERTGRRGLTVPLDGQDRPLHRVVLGLEPTHLLVDLLVFLRKQLLDQGDVLLLQHLRDLGQAHAELFHVGDHIQPGVLVDVVIPVSRFRIDVPGLEQALFVVKAQGGDGDPVHCGHLADGNQIVLHKIPPEALILMESLTPFSVKSKGFRKEICGECLWADACG